MRTTSSSRRCDRAPDTNRGSATGRPSVPDSVHRVLRSSGTPLDPDARRSLEPRFRRDFSSVRIHAGADAAQSAADVQARAWSAGNHIAFSPGTYAPHTPEGLHLLTHELTHVAQQSGAPIDAELHVGAADHATEREAHAAASAVQRGAAPDIRPHGGAAIRRLPVIPGDTAIDWGKVAAGVRDYLQKHPAYSDLTKEDIATAEKATGTKAPATAAPAAGATPRFVLHDTDSSMNMTHFRKQLGMKGPQGAGAVAWVPMQEKTTKFNPATKKMETTTLDQDPLVTREFFEEKRPTTTGFEKGDDIIAESTRNADFARIWQATAKAERGPALDRALAGTGLDPADAAKLKTATDQLLSGTAAPTLDGVKTTSGWAAAEVCKRVTAAGADAIADPDVKKHAAAVKTLTDLCGDPKLSAWFASRSRVGERTNVEIAQLGEGQPLPAVPYSEKQYDGVAGLYLQAALAARRWPFISTHRLEDRDIPGGHDDPRCFNVNKLYKLIASKMGHDPATIYGLEPKYGGPGDATANVTWTKSMCHADPPA